MTAAFLVALVVVLMFGVVVFFGAPYLPTLKRQRQQALDMLDISKEQMLFDLGCGDGSLLREAAAKGAQAVGYEINPILAGVAWLRTRRYRKNVKIVWGNFWKADISTADAVFVFLIGHRMKDLDKMLSRQLKKKKVRVVSHGFEIPGRRPSKQRGALYLYLYRV